jgi:hypothetical protein
MGSTRSLQRRLSRGRTRRTTRSRRIQQTIAVGRGLGVQPSQLINYAAGLPVDGEAAGAAVRTEDAIRNDPRFTEAQKKALLGVVRSYLEANEPE